MHQSNNHFCQTRICFIATAIVRIVLLVSFQIYWMCGTPGCCVVRERFGFVVTLKRTLICQKKQSVHLSKPLVVIIILLSPLRYGEQHNYKT